MRAATHEVSVIYGSNLFEENKFSMTEENRDEVIDKFRTGETRVLITTNILSRGIDVLQVSLVINYDLPFVWKAGKFTDEPDYQTYLHRIGRSARFNNSGIAINFVHDSRTHEAMRKFEDHFFPTKERTIQKMELHKLASIAAMLEEIM